MEFHPLAEIFPLLEGEAFKELRNDIAANGLQMPIVTLDGRVLDGRNRLRACSDAGVEPVFEPFTGDDPIAYVISLNLHRRHLTDSQRAIVAGKIVNHPGRGAKGLPKRVPGKAVDDGHITRADATRLLNITKSHVKMGRAVVLHGDPETVKAVERGDVKVGKAFTSLDIGYGKTRGTPTGAKNDHMPVSEHPLVRECFDWIEKLYDREREFKALPRAEKIEIVNEMATLLGVNVGQADAPRRKPSAA